MKRRFIFFVLCWMQAIGAAPLREVKVIHEYPHDPKAFTQGLFYEKGKLWEGTGLTGQSTLRQVDLKTGKVLFQKNLDPAIFGEGIALVADRIFQLSWRNQIVFEWDKNKKEILHQYPLITEGWGLTTLNGQLILSDGSSTLYKYIPPLANPTPLVAVKDGNKDVTELNELEEIQGYIAANIWQTSMIALIDIRTGQVVEYWDCKKLLEKIASPHDVLNGIAYDPQSQKIWLTGKLWNKLFEVQIQNSVLQFKK